MVVESGIDLECGSLLSDQAIHYNLTDRDHETLRRAQEVISSLAESVGGLVAGKPPVVMPPGSSLHYMGTTRMGARDDDTSVCDSHSRVWGFENLFVGGNGVIPTANACNPTLTSVALAIRACERLTGDLRRA